jgi:hypothetical protein
MLPVTISHVRVRIIYYDASGAVMDFEEFLYAGPIPPGLTKTVDSNRETGEAGRAAEYYDDHGQDGLFLHCTWDAKIRKERCNPSMSPKVELRIVGFDENDSQ